MLLAVSSHDEEFEEAVEIALGDFRQHRRSGHRHRDQAQGTPGTADVLDKQVTAAQATLDDLQAQKKTSNDAIAAQKATVNAPKDKLGAVQNQIKAIDGQIALGGRVA